MTRTTLVALVALSLAEGCLPNDTRPPPGSLLVTASGDALLQGGIPASATEDGWSIDYDRFLVDVGDAELSGDACNSYSDANYDRIFDMKVASAEKVSVQYALGNCDFGFRVGNPNGDTIVGAGATEADKTFMRTPGSDAYTGTSGVSIYVTGSARNGALTKTFAWAFRRRARYDQCSSSGRPAPSAFSLTGRSSRTLDLQVEGAALFRSDSKDPSALRFQIFADADTKYGNDDGDISLEELGRVPLTAAGFDATHAGVIGPDGAVIAFASPWAPNGPLRVGSDGGVEGGLSLEDYLYVVLFPTVLRPGATGTCIIDPSNRPR